MAFQVNLLLFSRKNRVRTFFSWKYVNKVSRIFHLWKSYSFTNKIFFLQAHGQFHTFRPIRTAERRVQYCGELHSWSQLEKLSKAIARTGSIGIWLPQVCAPPNAPNTELHQRRFNLYQDPCRSLPKCGCLIPKPNNIYFVNVILLVCIIEEKASILAQ